MKKTILSTSLAISLALGLAHAPALRADESDYSPTRYNPDEAKEMRSTLRAYLDPTYIPSPEYLKSWLSYGVKAGQYIGCYAGTETPEELKAQCAKSQAFHDTLVAGLPEKLSAPVARKRKILVLTYRTHTYGGAAGGLILLREAAKKYGAFELTEVYKLDDSIDEKMLAGFDAVVLNGITSVGRAGPCGDHGSLYKDHPELKEEVEKRRAETAKITPHLYNELLPNYVKAGGGLVAIHGAFLLPGFVTGWNEKADDPKNVFGEMLGGAADSWPHPRYGKISYNPIEMQVVEPENPLTLAFRDAAAGKVKFSSELYTCWLPKASINDTRLLLRNDYDKQPGVEYNPKSIERSKEFASAIIWIKNYGKGRVYCNVMGHMPEDFSEPHKSRALLDGLLYATDDLKVPDAPPTAAHAGQSTP